MMAPSLMGSCAIFATRESVVGEVTVGAPAGVDRAGTVGREFLLGWCWQVCWNRGGKQRTTFGDVTGSGAWNELPERERARPFRGNPAP